VTTVPVAKFFATAAEFRAWLEAHHRTAAELWVGFYKRGSGLASITWPQSVDEALCYGWIDGVRQSVDEQSYRIRFTPRRKGSTWSLVNQRRVEELRAAGRMQPAGLAAFEQRDREKQERYSYEREQVELSPAYLARLRQNAAAWKYFQGESPYYRRLVANWVMSAKREETRERRLHTLIQDSAQGLRIGPLRR
jgi:uncharacterized protein YdeI (YjbR/CyaY-like superfamily)